MPKAYIVVCYREISDPDAVAGYAALAGPAIGKNGGRALARGGRVHSLEGGIEEQTRRCWEISLAALEELGASAGDVIRTRTFLKNREDWEGSARVHGEFFSEVRPASTMLAVDSMIDPDWLVETELEAVLGES